MQEEDELFLLEKTKQIRESKLKLISLMYLHFAYLQSA